MAPSTTTAQAGPSGQGQAAAAPAEEKPQITTLEELFNALTGTRTQPQKQEVLKNFAHKETRDALLAGRLPDDADPLDRLSLEDNTLGYLYILLSRELHAAFCVG